MELSATDGYRDLLEQISRTYTQSQVQAMQTVNVHLIETYWQVGQHIVEFEQGGKIRDDYGKALISSLATDLSLRHGKGFSRSNLICIRQLYLAYPKGATTSHLFSWSHIVELLKIDDPLERSFYEQQILRERCSVRDLVRQKDSALSCTRPLARERPAFCNSLSKARSSNSPPTCCANSTPFAEHHGHKTSITMPASNDR